MIASAERTTKALREVFLASAWVVWDSKPSHITQLPCVLDAMNRANLAMFWESEEQESQHQAKSACATKKFEQDPISQTISGCE